MQNLVKDLRYGARMLVRSPGFTAVAVISLALGIGANAAIFTVVDAVLFKPLPIQSPDRVVALFTTDQRNPGNLPASHLNFKDLRDQARSFDGMGAVTFAQMNYAGASEAEQVPVQVVSGNYFSLLGVRPALGRGFLPGEDAAPGASPVVVLSHPFWENTLGSDRTIVNRTITLNRQPFTVVGVTSRGFTGLTLGGGPALWVPMSMHGVVQPGFEWYEQRRGLFLYPFARLRGRVTIEQARADVQTVLARLVRDYPDDNRGRSAAVMSLVESRTNPGGNGQLLRLSGMLMAVVAIVLLIACANIANLLLARGASRRREIAIRMAIGATRGRLVRQLLTESVLLAFVGGAAGIVVAFWTLSALQALDVPLPLPVADSLTLDARALVFTLVISALTGVLFGLAPALRTSRTDVAGILKSETLAGAAGRGLRGRHALVVGQIALSLVSLVTVGLFLRSLRETQAVEPGFETDRVLVMTFNLGREGYTPERGRAFHDQIVERATSLAGVRSAAIAQNLPFAGGFLRTILLEEQDTSTRDRTLVQVNVVGPRYFDTLGIPLLQGRAFTPGDREGAPQVVVINQTMAERFWPGGRAIGRRFRFIGETQPTEVIGIVRDGKYNALVEDPRPFIYTPILQNYTPAAALHVRTDRPPQAVMAALRDEVRRLDPGVSLFNIRTLRDQVEQSLAPQRANVALLTIFGAVALALAAVGLYGVASYSVAQRTREIGIRMALGAGARDVLGLVLGQGLRLVLAGIVLGTALAFVATRPLTALLFRTRAADPITFAATAALLAAVAIVASVLPARRAMRIDPLRALRTE